MSAALDGVRVLDLSRVLAGPWAGQNLADLGADVIKVERPGTGDDTRAWGPPWLCDEAGRPTAEAAYFLSCNRGKRSVTIDLTRPEGADLIRRLAADSHVVIENFKVGSLAKYGLDWPSLRALNPRLVYCSITGFGQTGPYRERAGYDVMIQAMGGLMAVTGTPEEPMKVGVALCDVLTGMYATVAVLAALRHAERTGEGQHIDIALLDVQVASLANQALIYLVTGEGPPRLGNAHPNIVPYQSFATADGHVIVAVGNDAQYRRFCEVLGRPELGTDPRYATNARRVENRAELVPRLAEALRARPSAYWLGRLAEVGVPCGPINELEQVFSDPQVQARGVRMELPHPTAGRVPLVASPMHLEATPPRYVRPPPTLGQHTEEVLCERLGLTLGEIDALRADGVV
jgi:crotonobetainyl-CoA:carnitine CoA-transferase CaiB-like acyl-CoA transferase